MAPPAEWTEGSDPNQMLDWLAANAPLDERKLRLLGCACCRQIWELLPGECRAAVEIAERYADGQASPRELEHAKKSVGRVVRASNERWGPLNAVWILTRRHASAGLVRVPSAAYWGSYSAVNPPGQPVVRKVTEVRKDLDRVYSRVFLEICGDRFRSVAIEKSVRTRAVVDLANAIYQSKHWGDMLILSDALEEAGCPDEALRHCRQDAPHYRGCWLLDWILKRD